MEQLLVHDERDWLRMDVLLPEPDVRLDGVEKQLRCGGGHVEFAIKTL